MSDPSFLTPAAKTRLDEELNELLTNGRAEIEARIAEARSHGDLRENADYDAAKNDQGMMEARIRQIRHILDTAEVRESLSTDVVEIGSVVTVTDEDGDKMEYFVAPAENKAPGLLLASPSSPLGASLLGAAVGDTVAYEAPGGTFEVTIASVRPYEG
ncbi:MAG: transcription elongation factor GreA [Acidimicrobiia bacterium]|nr:transcription elongation factor GreA [Acidimicrobiia bacterium]